MSMGEVCKFARHKQKSDRRWSLGASFTLGYSNLILEEDTQVQKVSIWKNSLAGSLEEEREKISTQRKKTIYVLNNKTQVPLLFNQICQDSLWNIQKTLTLEDCGERHDLPLCQLSFVYPLKTKESTCQQHTALFSLLAQITVISTQFYKVIYMLMFNN